MSMVCPTLAEWVEPPVVARPVVVLASVAIVMVVSVTTFLASVIGVD
jgi:hypothetical protein